MTPLKCLAAASILALSAHAAIACPGYGDYTMAAAQEQVTTAQSEPSQPAPVQQAAQPTPTEPTEVALVQPGDTAVQR
jgi:hypothetical protein